MEKERKKIQKLSLQELWCHTLPIVRFTDYHFEQYNFKILSCKTLK